MPAMVEILVDMRTIFPIDLLQGLHSNRMRNTNLVGRSVVTILPTFSESTMVSDMSSKLGAFQNIVKKFQRATLYRTDSCPNPLKEDVG